MLTLRGAHPCELERFIYHITYSSYARSQMMRDEYFFCFVCETKKRKRRRKHADHLSIDAESTNIFIFIIRV